MGDSGSVALSTLVGTSSKRIRGMLGCDVRVVGDEGEGAVSWVCDWCEEIGGGCDESPVGCDLVEYIGGVGL